MKENVSHKTVTINKMNQAKKEKNNVIIQFRKRGKMLNINEWYQQYSRRMHIDKNFTIFSNLEFLFNFFCHKVFEVNFNLKLNVHLVANLSSNKSLHP